MRDFETVLLTSCDEGYFPLAKGLFLSLLDSGKLDASTKLAFMDIGCEERSLTWLRDQGILIVPGTNDAMGALSDKGLGYHRAQTCRAFLPELFPTADILGWIDCDTWFQDPSIVEILKDEAFRYPDSIIIIYVRIKLFFISNNDI